MLKPVRRAKGKQIREQTKGVKVKFVGYLAHEAGCQEEEDLGIPLAITVWHGKRIVRDGNKQGEKKESRDGEKRKKKKKTRFLALTFAPRRRGRETSWNGLLVLLGGAGPAACGVLLLLMVLL